MRKKINLLILVGLIALMTCVIVACNTNGSKFVNDVPSEIGGGSYSEDAEAVKYDGGYAVISFSFKEMSSVFHSIIIDKVTGFDIESVSYSVAYTKNGSTNVTAQKKLLLDYVDADDRELLNKKGHHTIHVSVPFGDGTLRGSFSLHLRYKYDEIEYRKLTFNTDGGTPLFATASNNVATIEIEDGSSFTYEEFTRTFPITKAGYAVDSFNVSGNSMSKFSRSSTSKITITGDTTFTANWTDNVITVKFEVPAPVDEKGKVVPLPTGATAPSVPDQIIVRSVGTISRPSIEGLNVYNGYFFAGWYNKANNQVWNFTNPVGQDNITLYAKWTTRYYSTTIYTMSGDFKEGIDDSYNAGHTIQLQSLDVAKNAGYLIAKCAVTFNAASSLPMSLDISGLNYGAKYSDYVAEVNIDAKDKTKTKVIVLSDLFNAFEKPINSENLEGKILADTCLYSAQTCKETEKVEKDVQINGDASLYVKWNLDAKPTDEDYVDVISAFYTEILYKNSITIKADGTLKLVDIQDETFCDFILPDAIKFNGTLRYISEFGEKSVMNNRSIGLLDLEQANHLTTIGKETFINCSNLWKIKWPKQNNISSIGKSAFANTMWENLYEKEDSGVDFIIVNNILYEFIDRAPVKNPTKEVNLIDYYDSSVKNYQALNAELQSIKIISEDAFKNSVYLKSITLPDSVVEFADGAFENLSNLTYINVSSTSKLEKVSATAFTKTKLISDSYTSEYKNNTEIMRTYADEEVEVVKIGGVLVKVLDTSITNIKIRKTDGITAIAGEAFVGCDSLSTIIPESTVYSNIKYVGPNAFTSSVQLLKAQSDGCLIINNTLVEYYSKTLQNYNAVVSPGVQTIGSYSFNSYARHIKTVQIGEDVTLIKDYAFAGVTDIESLLFSNVDVNNSTNPTALINLPSFEALAFANSKGTLVNNINFYFYQPVLDYFESGKIDKTNPNEVEWYEFYLTNKDNFKLEKIQSVYVNTKVVDTMYVLTSKSFDWPTINDGIVLVSSAGVEKHYQLSKDSFITDFNPAEGIHEADLKKQWEGATYQVFKYTVVQAIKGMTDSNNYGFYSSKDKAPIIDGSTLGSTITNYWVEGFEGIKGETIPTFYTTQTSLDKETIKLCYNVIDDFKTASEKTSGTYRYVELSDYSDFSPNATNKNTITLTFNFKGAGQYKIRFEYKGVEPKVNSIEQIDSISIPLNADVYDALENAIIAYDSEDGIITNEYLRLSDFTIYSVNGDTNNLEFSSNVLGLNTVVLKYKGTKKVISTLQDLEIVYCVVLEGDASQFVFEIKGTGAAITAHNNKNVETLVIPSSYEKNGKIYDVTEIGDNVFSGYSKLSEVYLPATIVKIGSGAFSNCKVLYDIKSSTSTKNEQTDIKDSDFDVLTTNTTIEGKVTITNIDMSTGTIVIPKTLSYDSAVYVDTKVTAYPLFKNDLFDLFSGGLIYLDYSEEYLNYVKTNLIDENINIANGNRVIFMFKDSKAVEDVHVDENLQFLPYTDANIQFVESQIGLKDEDDKPIKMDINYLFYIICDDATRPQSTTQRHFTYDENTLIAKSKVINQTRKLKSLSSFGTTLNTIVVGDVYTKEETIANVNVTTISTTVSTNATLTYNTTNSVIVYLPDTIFNKCDIQNASSVAQKVIVYKHGEELLYSTNDYVSDSVTFIGNSAFEGCAILESIDLSKATKLDYIGAAAFKSSGLTSIDLSKTIIEDINNQTFEDCVNLVSIVLPTTAKNIGQYAFDGCVKLNITKAFFANIKYIGTNAFTRCTALTSIDLLEANIETVETNAFSNDKATIKVKFKASNRPEAWDSTWYGLCNVDYAE